MIVSIVAAVLWLHCCFIYMGAFFYEYQEAKRNATTIKGREDYGSDLRNTEKDGNTPTTEINSAGSRDSVKYYHTRTSIHTSEVNLAVVCL